MTALQTYRRDKRMTQEQMSKLVGISQPYYAMIEQGARLPSLRVAVKIQTATKGKVKPDSFCASATAAE